MKMIKTATIAILLMFAFGTNVQAGSTCYTNAYGQVVCSGSGGSETWTDTGWNWTSDQGNTCYTDAYGNFVCN